MTAQSTPRPDALPLAFRYYADELPGEHTALPRLRLRHLTALDQMYAYWGSDLE